MSLTLRQCRKALGLSQAQFAAELGVPLETYRTWDSGRRHVRPEVLKPRKYVRSPPRPACVAPARYPGAADPRARSDTTRRRERRTTSRHLRHAHDFSTPPHARHVGRRRVLLARVLRNRGLAETTPGTPALGYRSARLCRSDPKPTSTTGNDPDGVRRTGRRGVQGRGVPVGIAEALPIAAILATHSRDGSE